MSMNISVKPSRLCGKTAAPSSVDSAYGIFLAAALSDKFTDVFVNQMPPDLRAMHDALLSIGSMIWSRDFGYEVHPCSRALKLGFVDARGSAETLFYMMPVVAALYGYGEFTCGGELDKNMAEPLIKIMREHGCKFSGASLPFVVSGRLHGGSFVMPRTADARLVSSLLFSLPLLNEESEIVLTDRIKDRHGVKRTLEILHTFGIDIREYDNRFIVPRGAKYTSPRKIEVPADEKSSVFWLLANFLGSDVVTGIKKGELTAFLSGMKREGDLNINIANYAPLLPYFAAAASARQGKCRISGVHNAELTEQTCTAFSGAGAKIIPAQDGVTVYGSVALSGGICTACGNPDLTAALAVSSAVCRGTLYICDAEPPYPRFFEDFGALGGLLSKKQ